MVVNSSDLFGPICSGSEKLIVFTIPLAPFISPQPARRVARCHRTAQALDNPRISPPSNLVIKGLCPNWPTTFYLGNEQPRRKTSTSLLGGSDGFWVGGSEPVLNLSLNPMVREVA